MAAKKRPTAEDRLAAISIALDGIAVGFDLGEIARKLEPLHPKHDTFPGEVLLELAADALEQGGVSRGKPLDYEGIRERYLPEVPLSRARRRQALRSKAVCVVDMSSTKRACHAFPR